MKNISIVFLLILLLSAAAAIASWDPLENSTVSVAYDGPETPVLMVMPDGSGTPLTAARLPYGTVDGTITLQLIDLNGEPVPNMPREDMWLQVVDGGLAICPGGTVADHNSDANGETTWTAPLHAGGADQSGCRIVINGGDLYQLPTLQFQFNSPDLTGDLQVNLSDVAVFAGDYFDTYNFRSDFNGDGVVNLSDVPPMIVAVGVACP